MKKARIISTLALALALLMMIVNKVAAPLPDWAVRTAGVVVLLAVAAAAYCTIKGSMKQ